nr:SCP2 sterol-binding domain-containing protein [Candidatus Sigynarchaeota archaeon]
MSDSNDMQKPAIKFKELAKGIHAAVTPLIAAGIVMMLTGTIILVMPALSFVTNIMNWWPAYYIALIILTLGVGMLLIAAKSALAFARRVNELAKEMKSIMKLSPIQSAQPSLPTQRGGAPASSVIRPPLMKKEATTAAPASPRTETHPSMPTTAQATLKVQVESTPVEKPISASSGKPAEITSIQDAVNKIVERYNQAEVRSKFDGWQNTLMIAFPDLEKSFLFRINGSEGIDMTEGVDETASIQVSMASDMFIKLLSKQINAIKAYSSGALKVKGEMKNLLKLRKLMF